MDQLFTIKFQIVKFQEVTNNRTVYGEFELVMSSQENRNLFELRKHSSYGGSSYRGILLVFMRDFSWSQQVLELWRRSNYKGSSYGNFTV